VTALSTKMVDDRGRLTLGKEYAGRPVFVERVGDGILRIIKAEIVPAKEAWLHKNREAFESVMRGLEETGRGEFVDGPDLEADKDFAESCGE